MDETSTDLEGRRRRLLFRAQHRGTRETDILVGGFVAAGLASFSPAELAELEGIIQLPDTWLGDWLMGRRAVPEEYDSPMLRKMKEAVLS